MRNHTLFLTLCLSWLIVAPTWAAEPKTLDVFGDWSALTDGNKTPDYCYIGSQPRSHEEDGRPRGPIFVTVHHLKSAKETNVVRITAGYPYKPDSEARVTIGGKTFALFTEGEHAWARDADTDRQLVAAMRAGVDMMVEGTSGRGTPTQDIYSLSGFTAAHNAINAACGVTW